MTFILGAKSSLGRDSGDALSKLVSILCIWVAWGRLRNDLGLVLAVAFGARRAEANSVREALQDDFAAATLFALHRYAAPPLPRICHLHGEFYSGRLALARGAARVRRNRPFFGEAANDALVAVLPQCCGFLVAILICAWRVPFVLVESRPRHGDETARATNLACVSCACVYPCPCALLSSSAIAWNHGHLGLRPLGAGWEQTGG